MKNTTHIFESGQWRVLPLLCLVWLAIVGFTLSYQLNSIFYLLGAMLCGGLAVLRFGYLWGVHRAAYMCGEFGGHYSRGHL